MLQVLRSATEKAWTPEEITDKVYPGLEEKLKLPAKSNSMKVLQALLARGNVMQSGNTWKYVQGASSM